jgi:hypothetical protein
VPTPNKASDVPLFFSYLEEHLKVRKGQPTSARQNQQML